MTQITLARGATETGANEWNDVYSNDLAITTVVNGQLSNDNLDASAAIAHSKLANGTSGQLLVANSSGVITSTTVTGDVTISSTGVTAIGTDKVTATQLKDSASVDADRAVTTDHIRDSAVTAAKVADNTLPYAKVKADAWTSYTPTVLGFAGTNWSLGNATVAAAYVQVGKMVTARVKITTGSTTTYGSGTYIVTLPTSVASDQQGIPIGVGSMYDFSAVANYRVYVAANSLGAQLQYVPTSSLVYQNIGNGTLFSLATSDVLQFTCTYEAA